MEFQELIAKYKELIRQDGNTGELYKWRCIKHFKDNFNIDALDFAAMLKMSLKKRSNLLHYNSSGFIIAAAEQFPKKTREMFCGLYNEDMDLTKRLKNFEEQADSLLKKVIPKSGKKICHQQDERTLSFYLAMMYPEKYPLYMSKIYDFMLLHLHLHLPDEVECPTDERFLHFIRVSHKFSEVINNDKDLLALGISTLDSSCFEGKQSLIIFQDILWRCHQIGKKVNLARICWNTNKWKNPSGPDGKSTSDDSHEGEYGFGNEEWLFDFSKMVDGYHYGYLQPINKGGKKYLSVPIDIVLYTIDGKSKKRYLVAKIKNLHVLSEDEAKEAFLEYKAKGWLSKMEQQIREIFGAKGADEFHKWSDSNVLNVKFRDCDVIECNQIYELPKSFCRGLDRYRLYIKEEYAVFPEGQEGIFAPKASGDKNADESTDYLIKSTPPKGRKELPKHNPSFAGVDDIDYEKEQRDATVLGRSGEDLVIKYEKEKLKRLGLEHLIDQVGKRKDGEGYDILSFDKDGNEILIEVKTTIGGIDTPFDISWNEVKRAEKDCLKYKIYRLYNFDKNSNSVPRFYVVDDIDSLLFEPVNFKAYWKENTK